MSFRPSLLGFAMALSTTMTLAADVTLTPPSTEASLIDPLLGQLQRAAIEDQATPRRDAHVAHAGHAAASADDEHATHQQIGTCEIGRTARHINRGTGWDVPLSLRRQGRTKHQGHREQGDPSCARRTGQAEAR